MKLQTLKVHIKLQQFEIALEVAIINSKLKLCDKRYTYHASNMFLQCQYREFKFKKYSELI